MVVGPIGRGTTAAAPSDSVFRALCTNLLTYFLTYLQLCTKGEKLKVLLHE